MQPLRLFKCLADDTRLMLMLLIQQQGELCVCEMTHILEESQPKVSRHLAQLRGCGLLVDQRDGQWVYYRLAPDLPEWALQVLSAAAAGDGQRLERLAARLAAMGNRPERRAALC
ncbi:metalloregulator ArsR/SmtB family transcription factor [Halomonas sp. ML-15]|uniref:metalloregulator ArsR/SmtB family transcription factor n=1 Tax=Halomonas sp. ML-15 TaxID=2773305 RepID=UPI0017475D6D|nr:metalloregulator ArsR/SmtB family transcription factor [Halomonas sp. ML-15]MBD3895895.1 metalloregulator ArsR/SmtB family transcription factor [Halomonas sp. ML-15]